MKQQRKPEQEDTKVSRHLSPFQSDQERYKLLDLRIGLMLLGEEGRKQLLQYMRAQKIAQEQR